MSTQLMLLLAMLIVSSVLLILGMVIKRHGPQGFVHGLGDWSQLDAAIRERVGRVIGNMMFAIATLLTGFGIYGYFHVTDQQRMGTAGLLLMFSMTGLSLGLILYLLRVQKSGSTGRHGR